MILLLSYQGEWLLAAAIFCVISGLVALGTLNADMKERPWKYKQFLDADEARKKAKEKAKEQSKKRGCH